MPLPLQSKLLRVLQEKEFEPVGSNDVIQSDVRVIAATSTDLEAAIKRGEFRADLYYRLNVLPIQVPPLRERLEDLPALSEAILEELRSQHELSRGAGAAGSMRGRGIFANCATCWNARRCSAMTWSSPRRIFARPSAPLPGGAPIGATLEPLAEETLPRRGSGSIGN
jgi:sigma54-dependent transcription regulator